MAQTDFTKPRKQKDNMFCSSHQLEAGWSMHGRSLKNFIRGLLIIGHWGRREIRVKDYELCIHDTKRGKRIFTTLIFYGYYKCQGTQKGTYNQTQYSVRDPGNNQPYVCYNPTDPFPETASFIKLCYTYVQSIAYLKATEPTNMRPL